MTTISTLKRLYADSLLTVAIATTGMTATLTYLGIREKLDAAEWASWVQAVGSISALLLAMALADNQTKQQQRLERIRDAKNDLRIADFAEAVIRESLDAIHAVRDGQVNLSAGSVYTYPERSRIQAAQVLARTLITEPLFSELINPVLNVHHMLVEVDSQASELCDHRFPKTPEFFESWRRRSQGISNITTASSNAMAVAHQASGAST